MNDEGQNVESSRLQFIEDMREFDFDKFLRDNYPSMTPEQHIHVSHCLRSLSMLYAEGWFVGDFLTAVSKNDLMRAIQTADETNRQFIHAYCAFIYNEVPVPLVQWARARGRKV